MADQQRRVSLIFEADTSRAKASINELVSSLRNISATPTDVVNLANIQQATRAAMELEHHIQRAVNTDTGKLDLGRFTTSLERSGTNLQQYLTTLNKIGPAGNQTFKNLATAINNASTSTTRLSKGMANFMTTMKNTVKWQISSSIMHGMISSVQQAYGYAKSLDKTLNDIRIVSGHSAAEMSRFAESANRAAQQLRTTTDQYAKASLIFYQQGLGDAEIEKRTAAVIKMANVTGEAVKDVSSYMTAIWNNFDEGGRSLESFADVMTALGAATASSSAEIAGGLEKFVAIGEQIGLSFDYAATALATITAQTRQSEDVVGNALKTIFARIQGLNLGETLDDGTTLNKYSEALAKVGINIKDTSGQIKDMDVILNEMGSKWQTFGKDTQIALAQAVAGVRQYNQVMSLMNDWDVFKHNLDIAKNSKGTLNKQADIYAESWEASTKQVKNALQGVYDALFDAEPFMKLNSFLTDTLGVVKGLVKAAGGLGPILQAAFGTFLSAKAQQAPIFLQNMLDNFKIMAGFGQTKAQQTQSQMTQALLTKANQSTNGADKMEFQQLAQVSVMREKILSVQHLLNSEQQRSVQLQLQQAQAAADTAIAKEKELDSERQRLAQTRMAVAAKEMEAGAQERIALINKQNQNQDRKANDLMRMSGNFAAKAEVDAKRLESAKAAEAKAQADMVAARAQKTQVTERSSYLAERQNLEKQMAEVAMRAQANKDFYNQNMAIAGKGDKSKFFTTTTGYRETKGGLQNTYNEQKAQTDAATKDLEARIQKLDADFQALKTESEKQQDVKKAEEAYSKAKGSREQAEKALAVDKKLEAKYAETGKKETGKKQDTSTTKALAEELQARKQLNAEVNKYVEASGKLGQVSNAAAEIGAAYSGQKTSVSDLREQINSLVNSSDQAKQAFAALDAEDQNVLKDPTANAEKLLALLEKLGIKAGELNLDKLNEMESKVMGNTKVNMTEEQRREYVGAARQEAQERGQLPINPAPKPQLEIPVPSNLAVVTQTITAMAGAAMTANSAMNSLRNAMDIWSDEDATPFEKVGAALSLMTTGMMFFNSASKIGNAITSRRIALQQAQAASGAAVAAGEAAATAGINSNTGAVVANTAAWMSNPIGLIITMVVMALAAVFAIATKAIENNTKKLKENAEAAKENADAVSEEVTERQKLVQTYYDELAVYEQTKSNKEALADAAREVAEAYELENAQMLIAQGNYEALNRLIGDASSKDRQQLMQAQVQDLEAQVAVLEDQYGAEGYDPDKFVKTYSRGTDDVFQLASDTYEVISQQEADSIDALGRIRVAMASSIESYASDIENANKIVTLAGQSYVTVVKDGMTYLVGANGQIYTNVEAAIRASDPSELIATEAVEVYEFAANEFGLATDGIDASGASAAIADSAITYADHVANIADSASSVADAETGKVENAVVLFSAKLQQMAGGNWFTNLFSGRDEHVQQHSELAQDYFSGYITEASQVGTDNLLFGDYAASRHDAVMTSDEAARMLASQMWFNKGESFSDLDIFKDYDSEQVDNLFAELGYDEIPDTMEGIIAFIEQFYTMSDSLRHEMSFGATSDMPELNTRVPFTLRDADGNLIEYEYDLLTNFTYYSGTDYMVDPSQISTQDGLLGGQLDNRNYRIGDSSYRDELVRNGFLDVGTRMDGSIISGGLNAAGNRYYYDPTTDTFIPLLTDVQVTGDSNENGQQVATIIGGLDAQKYTFKSSEELEAEGEDGGTSGRLTGAGDAVTIDRNAAIEAASGDDSEDDSEAEETPANITTSFGFDEEGRFYTETGDGQRVYAETNGASFDSGAAIDTYNEALRTAGVYDYTVGLDSNGQMMYSKTSPENTLEYYLNSENGGTAAQRYESFMGYRGNRVTVDEISSIASYFGGLDPNAEGYAEQFIGANGLNEELAAQFFGGDITPYQGHVVSDAQARILGAYAAADGYTVLGDETTGYSVYTDDQIGANGKAKADAVSVFNASGISEGIVLQVPDGVTIDPDSLSQLFPDARLSEDGKTIQLMSAGEDMTNEQYADAIHLMDQLGLKEANSGIYENMTQWMELVKSATAYDTAAKKEVIYNKTRDLDKDISSADLFASLGGVVDPTQTVQALYGEGYNSVVASILEEASTYSPEDIEQILAEQGFAEQGKALRHVLEHAASEFQYDLLQAYDNLSEDQKTIFFSIDFSFLIDTSNVEAEVNKVIGYIRQLNDAVNAEQYKIKAEQARESWADVDTVDELRDFETSSGIQWGSESGLSAKSGYEQIITYSEFLAMSHEEQIGYINGLVAAYDEGYSTIIKNGIEASQALIQTYKDARLELLQTLYGDSDGSFEELYEKYLEDYTYDAGTGKWRDKAGTEIVDEDKIRQLEQISSLTNSIGSEEIRIEGFEESLALEVVLNRREYDAFIKEVVGSTITIGVVFEVEDTEQLKRLLGDDLSDFGFINSAGKFVVTGNPQELHDSVLQKELERRQRSAAVGTYGTKNIDSSYVYRNVVSNDTRYGEDGSANYGTDSIVDFLIKMQDSGMAIEDMGLTEQVITDAEGKIIGLADTTQETMKAVMTAIMAFETGAITDLQTLLEEGIITSYKDVEAYNNTFGTDTTLTPKQQEVLDYNFATAHGMTLASYNQGLRTTADSAAVGYMGVFGGTTLDEQYQNRILAEEQLTAEGYDGAAIIEAILQSALDGDIELNTPDDLDAAIAQEKETVGVYNRESGISGFGVEEIKEEVEYLEKYGDVAGKSKEEIIELANANLRFGRALEAVREKGDDWIKTLKKGDKESQEYKDTVKELEENYEDLFNLQPGEEFTKQFVESAENAERFQKAMEGDEQSYRDLQKAAADDLYFGTEGTGESVTSYTDENGELLLQVGVDEATWDSALADIQADILSIDDINVDADMNLENINAKLSQLKFNSLEAAQSASSSLSKIGVDANIVPHTVTVPASTSTTITSGMEYVPGNPGKLSPVFSMVKTTTPAHDETYYTLEGTGFNGNVGMPSTGSGRRGGGGGGGGGGSRNPQARKKTEPDKERYHTVKNQLEDLTDAYDKVSKAADRAFGKSRIKLLREQQEALKDLAATQQDYIDEINSYYKQDLSNLDQVSQYIGFDVQLDENGTITNFDDIQNAMWDEYNSHINDNEEVTDMDEEAWKKYEEEWNRIMELITTYEETQDLRKEALQQLQDYINEIYDLQLEEITYAVEVDIEASDDALKILDYMLSRIEDDAWAAAEAITYMGDKAATILDQNNTYTSGIRDILMNHTQDIKDSNGKVLQKAQLSKADVEGFMAGDAEAIDKIMKLNDAFTEEEVENLRDYHNSLIEMNESLVELRESVFDKVLDSFEKFNEEMDKSIEKIDHLSAVTENYKNIIDIVGKKNLNISNALLDSLNQANVEQRINRVDATRTKRDTIAAEITRAEAALADARSKGLEEDAKLWEKTLEEMRNSLDEAEEDFMQSWEDALDSIREQFEEAVGHAVETLSDALAGPLMGSMDQLQDAFDRQNTIAERYLPDYEKIYELNKLNRDITNSIDETDNIKAKQELAELQAEINALEESEAEISEYQMENLRRRYELKMAEIALTEAQDAKSQVQMSRDADGNWSYVYTANEDQVAEAEQNYEDRLFAIQQANAEYINAMQESMVQLEAEMAQKIEEIMLDETLSAEEKMAKLQEVTTFYQGQMEYYMDELELVLGENQVLYEQDWTKYNELTGYKISANQDYVDNFNETALSTLTGFQTMEEFQQNFNDAIGHPDSHGLLYDLSQAYDTWAANTEAAMNSAGTSISDFADDMAEDVDDILDASEDATDAIGDMGEKVKDTFTQLTDAVENWSEVYSAKIDAILQKNTALAESFNKLLQAWSDYNESTTDDSTDAPSEEEQPTDDGEPADEGADVPDTVAEKTEKYKKGIAFAIWSHPSSGWGHGNSSKNLTSGDRFNRLKAKGLDPNTVQQQINAYRGKSTDYMKKDSGISFKKWSDRVGALNPYTYKKFAFDTGGYTGDWGEEGRWALLHSKEIVLNKDDTANLLSAVDMIRQISKAIDLNAYSSAGYGNSIIKAGIGEGGTLEQNVHITAEFPNATNREEIYSAFTDIINLASQYANRK